MKQYVFIAPDASRPLNFPEMQNNALAVGVIFKKAKWTPNAIAGMLGNMQAESTINPSRWQDDEEEKKGGYGLVQWTPYTKYSEWAGDGWERNGVKECERILYELHNKIQWVPTDEYPFSFEEYSKMHKSPEYMADAFLKNYERPENQNQPIRGEYALYWYKYILKYLYPNIWIYFQFDKYYRKEVRKKYE